MNNRRAHIISQLGWHTSFDRKDKASELQERLSAWSRIYMQREILRVFDKLCPATQTWKIKKLELDLGPIDYSHLESELSKKLAHRLTEKLTDLFIYVNRNDNTGIEIEVINEEESQLHVLAEFLLRGQLPWSHLPERGAINELMAQQLELNFARVIDLVRKLGATHENVRKRIAWQISEPSIIKIIKGLEPNNHQQIVNFSEELVKVKKKKAIVIAGDADFKRNVWLWALNYLLTERGTIFNKMAFMKSAIRQMAAHHNIAYEELFSLIVQVVNEISRKDSIRADFVITLKLLAQENKDLQSKARQRALPPNPWHLLENLHTNMALYKSVNKRGELNDMITGLYSEDAKKFRQHVAPVLQSEKLLAKLVENMSAATAETLLAAINPAQAHRLGSHVRFIETLLGSTDIKIAPDRIWAAAVLFLKKQAGTPFTTDSFVDWFVEEISSVTSIPRRYLLIKLALADIPASAKSAQGISVYTRLLYLGSEEVLATNHNYFSKQLEQLTKAVTHLHGPNKKNVSALAETKYVLALYMQANPGKALNLLEKYPDKVGLRKAMPRFLSNSVAVALCRELKPALLEVLERIQEFLRRVKLENRSELPIILLQEGILNLAVSAVALAENITPAQFFNQIIAGSLGLLNTSQQRKFKLALASGMPEELKQQGLGHLVASLNDTTAILFSADLYQGLQNKVYTPLSVCHILLSDTSRAYGLFKTRGTRENKALLNYLLPQGYVLISRWLKEQKQVLDKNGKPAYKEQSLYEILWKCLLDYASYEGNSDDFQKCYRLAVTAAFGGSGMPGVTYAKDVRRKSIPLAYGKKLQEEKLFELLTEYIAQGTLALKEDSGYHFSDLVLAALEEDPDTLRKVLARESISPRQIENLQEVISLERFCFYMSAASPHMQEGYSCICILHGLAADIIPGRVKDFTLYCWKKLSLIIKTNSFTEEKLKELIQELLRLSKVSGQLNVDAIAAEMARCSTAPMLRRALASLEPALQQHLLPESENTEGAQEELMELAKKRLLDEFIFTLVTRMRVPGWYVAKNKMRASAWLAQALAHQPARLRQALKHEIMSEQQLAWLNKSISFKNLVNAIGLFDRGKQGWLGTLEQFHAVIGNMRIPGISARELQQWLFKKVLLAWSRNNWSPLQPDNIWKELAWDICTQKKVSQKGFFGRAEKIKFMLPPSLRLSLGQLKEKIVKPAVIGTYKQETKSKGPLLSFVKKQDAPSVTLPVKNAGLVILISYLPMLFERLGFVQKQGFLTQEIQEDAVHYLQYLVTGLDATPEELLLLNKLLCGLDPMHPVRESAEISSEQKELMDGLILAAISHWPVIGSCSVDGFRGNWLVRDGLLAELEDKWELTVEKRAYDMLINKSPFSFSIIKFPWMSKPIHVIWPY